MYSVMAIFNSSIVWGCNRQVHRDILITRYNALCAAEEEEHEVLDNIVLGVILSFQGRKIIYKYIIEIYRYMKEVCSLCCSSVML
jgi:hypothetical protein